MAKRRRGLRGLAGLGNLRSAAGREVVTPIIGVGLAVGVTLAVRAFVRPDTEAMQQVYRWAPAIGAGASLIGAGALAAMVGRGAAWSAGTAGVVAGVALLASETLNASRPGGATATGVATMLPASAPGTAGLAALVPESLRGTGMGVITMDPVRGTAGAYGETVNLRGSVNQAAFGKPTFGG
jgi:hypothetical protein